METEPMNEPRPYPSPAAERMRRYRDRRRQGLRCLMIEMPEAGIDALVGLGLLKTEMRNDASAIVAALYTFIHGTLGSIAGDDVD